MDSLPPELIPLIASHLRRDSSSLNSLCLASKRFLFDARRLLYKNLAVVTSTTSSAPLECIHLEIHKGNQLLATFTETNPSLAQLVHTFEYTLRQKLWKELGVDLQSRLSTSLELMINLKHLSFFSVAPEFPLINVLKRCTFRLESFEAWEVIYSPSPLAFQEYFSTQPQLKKLQVWWPKSESFRDNCCPNLEMLAGDTFTIDAILPGRPITHLSWSQFNKSTISLTPTMIYSISNLHTLCVKSWYPSTIEPLVPHLGAVQVLHYARMFRSNLPGVEDFIYVSRLPSLRIFIHSTQNVFKNKDAPYILEPPERKAVEEAHGPMVQNWFGKLPHLRVAYFQVSDTRRNEKSFLAWERGRDEPAMVEGMKVWNISPWN